MEYESQQKDSCIYVSVDLIQAEKVVANIQRSNPKNDNAA